MEPIRYRPTGDGTPNPALLRTLSPHHVGRWVPVTEALPPDRTPVLVVQRGDGCPAFAWLEFAAGDEASPFFVCPQGAAMEPRGCHHGKRPTVQRREDVTHWFAPTPGGLPWAPPGYEDAEWGLTGCGWEHRDERLNPPD